VIALAEYLLDASEGILDQFGGVLGGHGKEKGYAVGVLQRIGTTICQEKDGERASNTLSPVEFHRHTCRIRRHCLTHRGQRCNGTTKGA
jgi:hypothetical protein